MVLHIPQSSRTDGLVSYPGNYIYIYKQDFALNNPQGLICHKTQSNLLYVYNAFLKGDQWVGFWFWGTGNCHKVSDQRNKGAMIVQEYSF